MKTECFGLDRVDGFLHAEGQKIVNGRGDEVVLRGLGAANWNNPEGFMIGGFSGFEITMGKVNAPIGRMDRGRSFGALIRELCGTKYEQEFWPKWFRNHLAEADIRQMAEWGFNSVRLPLDARTLLFEEPGITFNEDTFAMLNDVLDWCEKYRIYAILDLHAAVGGQSALPCDDGVDAMPHLFYDEESWERTMLLCEELAKRYAGRTIVGAYDLINEPISGPLWEEYIPKLQAFYHEMVSRMRAYDKNHLLLLNGHIFSSRVDMFTENYDPECNNWGLAIHNYGGVPDMVVFNSALERGHVLNIPVWMGEGGGSALWMTGMYELAVEHRIGFNIWCYKAADAGDTSHWFCTHKLPKEWDMVIKYARDGGPRPSYEHAQAIFDEYLELLKYENCHLVHELVPYVLRKPGCTVPAVAFDVTTDCGCPAFNGKFTGGYAVNCHVGDHLHIIPEKGYTSQIGTIGPQDLAGDWEHYVLELSADEYVTYTLRNCKKENTVTVVLESCGGTVEISVNDQIAFSGRPQGDQIVIKPEIDCDTLKLKAAVSEGQAVLKQIIYA